jgi:hypothetical protein
MHFVLFKKLDTIGIRGAFLKLIKAIYETSRSNVRTNSINSENIYAMTRGTRQGCPLSPTLFLTFVNDLGDDLPKGIDIPEIKEFLIACLEFTDDLALFANTISE